jgi:ankyrin repeat protein
MNLAGQYAHMIAETHGHVRLAKTLIDSGLKHALTDRLTDTVMAFVRDGAGVNVENDENWTPLLHVSALSADVSYARSVNVRLSINKDCAVVYKLYTSCNTYC